MCSQVSNSVIKCLWTDNSGKVVSHNVTIQGMSLSFATNKGHYSGNGVIIWENGDRWDKQGTIFISIHIDGFIDFNNVKCEMIDVLIF